MSVVQRQAEGGREILIRWARRFIERRPTLARAAGRAQPMTDRRLARLNVCAHYHAR